MVQVFGTRHLSPAGAWHVRAFLDRVKPTLVQIEGLSDANELIEHICDRRTRPPVAILAYTQAVPIRTIVYPLARYSPEYQAMAWALEHDVEVELIDLPSDIFLGLLVREHDAEPETTADDPPRKSTYDAIAERFGEPSYTSYWERHFEHNLADDSYRSAALELGRGLRELEAGKPRDFAENLVREAFMRRQVEKAIKRGHAPDKIAVLVGAFHAPVIDTALPAMTDAELEKLPRAETKLTLMPYSYFRLSSQSGYGAGNHAPAYFEMLWDAMQAGEMDHLAANYLSQIVRRLRKGGTSRSTAEVIEGVRLARTLSALHSGQAPTLLDLQDAARTLIGHGQASVIGDARARVEVGTEIGELPPGVSQTSIQLDFAEQLRRLKLEKYKTTVKAELALDLRENRRAKSEDAAFLDLNRSFFLHRLAVLNVSFAKPVRLDDRGASYKEMWQLQWTPESEIELVEAVLLGETVDLAASYAFKQRLESCGNAADAARIVRQACDCGMPKTADAARATVQALAATTSDFVTIAEAAAELARVIRYGDVRQFDREPLMPLVSELFVQGVLALPQAAKCDNQSMRRRARRALGSGPRGGGERRAGGRRAVPLGALGAVRRGRPEPAAQRLRLRAAFGAEPDRHRGALSRGEPAPVSRYRRRSGRGVVRGARVAQPLRAALSPRTVAALGGLRRVPGRRRVPAGIGVSAARLRELQHSGEAHHHGEPGGVLGRGQRRAEPGARAPLDGSRRDQARRAR